MRFPLDAWRDRRVWIVGASSGIGAALARALLGRGARVALSARSADKLEALAAGHPTAWSLPLDATSPEALASAWASIVERWGGADLVVCLAGTYAPVRAWELSAEKARTTVDANLLSGMYLAACVLPTMLAKRDAAIAFVSSVAGYRGLPKALVYGPTKAALINFAETLQLDLVGRGVGVFLINPGFVETPLTAGNEFRMPALISADEAAAHILAGLDRGRFEIHFPRRFTLWLKLLRCLPYRAYFWLVARVTGA
jgi:NAD(P)-dependent dehydrogenase (short-subunit alcohol dehydrogenase family)